MLGLRLMIIVERTGSLTLHFTLQPSGLDLQEHLLDWFPAHEKKKEALLPEQTEEKL